MSEIAHGALWVPGAGMTSVDELAAARAVTEYDSDLTLGHRRDTNEWIVFHKHGPNGEPFPLLSFGPKLPHPEQIKKKMYETDVRRHGAKLFHDIQRRNDERMEAGRKLSSEASEQMAEALVSGFDHQGFRPFFKSLPNKNPKAKAGR